MTRAAWAKALLSCFGLSACGGLGAEAPARDEAAIFGGSAVAEGDFENVVALPSCSAVLVAPTLVLYAAHCGTDFDAVTMGSTVAAPLRRLPLTECRAHPDAALGNGLDAAYCVLANAVSDVPSMQLLASDEAADVQVGMTIKQVGYGLDNDEGVFGTKRETQGTLQSLGDDFVVSGVDGGTCDGDSGGPALVRLDDLDPDNPPTWALLGLLSAGTSYECGISTDHYTNVQAVRGWIEAESGISLAPARTNARAPESRARAVGCQSSPSTSRAGSSFGLVAGLGAWHIAGRRRRKRSRRS